MKAHQQAAVPRSDQPVACMGQRGVQLRVFACVYECVSRYCLDEQSCEARSVSERQRGEWRKREGGGVVLGRGSTKPHEGWRASKNVTKLYSFAMKGRNERQQEKKKGR